MKKDIEKYQLAELTTRGEQKISSAALVLQLFNKEKEMMKEVEKKESAAEAAKLRCKVCFKEIAPKRLCSGHGGGGGSDDATADKNSEEEESQDENKSLTKPRKVIETMDELIDEFGSIEDSDALDEKSFDPEVIVELIAKGLLLVDSDRESRTITIKLLCEPYVLTEKQREELKKFMEAITTAFNEFKEENNLSYDCIKIIQDEKGNILSLNITMPTLALYDTFIQRLANNLVPIPNLKERDEITKERSLAPASLSIEPKPSNKTSKQDDIEHNKNLETKKLEPEEQEIFNPSPFNMKPW